MSPISKLQSNVFAALFALVCSAAFVGISVIPAEVGSVAGLIA